MIFFGFYLLVSAFITKKAANWAKANNKNQWLWGGLAIFVMYNLVFWDLIPTQLMHKYYCSTQAGFWEYKTPEQWRVENPGVMETLVNNKGAPSERDGDMQNYTDTYFLNQRIKYVIKKSGPHFINVWQFEQIVSDIKNNEILARHLGFTSGNGKIGGEPPFRLWLQSIGCNGISAINDAQFYDFRHEFLGRQE